MAARPVRPNQPVSDQLVEDQGSATDGAYGFGFGVRELINHCFSFGVITKSTQNAGLRSSVNT